MTASIVKTANLTSALITEPNAALKAGFVGGAIKIAQDTVAVATTSLDDIGDTILTGVILPSNAVLSSLTLYNDDLDTGGTSGAVNIGLYNGPDKFVDTDSGATIYKPFDAISAALFLSAGTQLTGANKTAGVDLRFNALALNTMGKQLWDLAGLTQDPQKLLVVGIAVTTAMTTPQAGSVAIRAHFSQ